MSRKGPILDLAAVTLEVTNLDRCEAFYSDLVGLETIHRDDAAGVLEMRFSSGQTLRFWLPKTGQHNDDRLAQLGARGGTHVHWAMQIPLGSRDATKHSLNAHGVVWQEIDLGDEAFHDFGLYFFDPFGHGLELREVSSDHDDTRAPFLAVGRATFGIRKLPVVGLREVALAFTDFPSMLERLPAAYGFCLAKVQAGRAFAQFTLGPQPEADGKFTPRRWLYAWDPQVGLADMLGGEHVLMSMYADVAAVARSAQAYGLEFLHDELGLVVRDPEGHVFEFLPFKPEIN